MYDDSCPDDFPRWRPGAGYEPFGPSPGTLDRLTHLVLVDGRLVEAWSEPVTGTRWQDHADRFDAERRPLEPSPPPLPPWQRVLDWLSEICGGQQAVAALDAEPLSREDGDLPVGVDASARDRLEATADLLGAVADRWFDDETAVALRRALVLVWEEEPETVLGARSAAHLAGGICWAVGKANGCYRPQGDLTMARVQEALALSTTISGYGATVRRALVGFRELDRHRWWRPDGVPSLEPLGRLDLLSSSTRKRLLRVRERAEAARSTAA
jgi:hypothetical protein